MKLKKPHQIDGVSFRIKTNRNTLFKIQIYKE